MISFTRILVPIFRYPQNMPITRTPDEFASYEKRLEELAWRLVGHRDEYEALMEEGKLDRLSYVEALERLVLLKSGGAD